MKYLDSEQWVLEWSHGSNNLHIQPLARLLGLNQSRFIVNARPPGDYVLLAVGTHSEVSRAADNIRAQIIERE